jgi:hypothetical protein
MYFIVIGHCGQNHKKADLSLKINFFQNFLSRFGFLVQYYLYPKLGLKKYAQGQELLIFRDLLKNLAHCVPGTKYDKNEPPRNLNPKKINFLNN